MYERNFKPCCTVSEMEDIWQLSVTAHSIHLKLSFIPGGCLLHLQPEEVSLCGDKGPS